MDKEKDYNLSDKIKEIGIGNSILIFVFIIFLIYFIISSIGYYGKKIFGGKEVNIYYDYDNFEEYSLDTENNFYKTELVTDSTIFYNIEDIIKVIFRKITDKEYRDVYSIFSGNVKRNYDLSEKQILEKLEGFNNNYLFENSNVELKKIDHIINSNIYICYLNNVNNQERKIVLNVDFDNLTYKIEDFDFYVEE